jgi:anti-sigma B factor antagonist
MSLTINIRDNRGVCVIDVSGRLTLGEQSTMLKDEIRRLLSEGKRRILLNLERLTQMDSSGMGLLVGTYVTVDREGGQLKLTNLPKRIKDLLLITKLHTVFEIYQDEPTALGSFAVAAG